MRNPILSSGLLAVALIAGPAGFAQAQQKPFCLQSPTGAVNCLYDSFEQCEQIRGGRSVGGGCIPNPAARSGTTGRGGDLEAPRRSGPNNLDRTPLQGGGVAPQR
jgi:hypothetical protein